MRSGAGAVLMPKYTETLREIAEGIQNVSKATKEIRQLTLHSWPSTHSNPPDVENWRTTIACLLRCETELKNSIEKLLASAECDLVEKWREPSAIAESDSASVRTSILVIDAVKKNCADELETWLSVNLPRIKDDARTEQDAKWTAALGFGGVLGPETIAKQVAHEKAEAECKGSLNEIDETMRYVSAAMLDIPALASYFKKRIAELKAQAKGTN